MNGQTPYNAPCVKCGHVRGGKPHYAARMAKCKTWLAGCKLCFKKVPWAKKAVKDYAEKHSGRCVLKGCKKCVGYQILGGGGFGDIFGGMF